MLSRRLTSRDFGRAGAFFVSDLTGELAFYCLTGVMLLVAFFSIAFSMAFFRLLRIDF